MDSGSPGDAPAIEPRGVNQVFRTPSGGARRYVL